MMTLCSFSVKNEQLIIFLSIFAAKMENEG